MADETAVIEVEQQVEQEQATQEEQPKGEQKAEPEIAGIEVSIDGVSPPQAEEEPQHIRDLRQRYRDQAKELRELRAKVSSPAQADPDSPGKKPTMGDPDIDYDADKFESALLAWNAKVAAAESAKRKREEEAQAQQRSWQAVQDTYAERKQKLGVKDYAEAEDEVKTKFSVEQQGVMMYVQDGKSEVTVYALGKNASECDRLAAIKDPLKLAYELGKLETKVKVTQRKPETRPETVVRGDVSPAGVSDKELQRLEDEAEKSGDRTKVIAYKRQLKAAAK